MSMYEEDVQYTCSAHSSINADLQQRLYQALLYLSVCEKAEVCLQ